MVTFILLERGVLVPGIFFWSWGNLVREFLMEARGGGEGGLNFWCSEKVGYSLPGKLPSVTIESFNR